MDKSSINSLALGMALETINLMQELKEQGFYKNGTKGEEFFEGIEHTRKMIEGFVKAYEDQWGNLASVTTSKEEEKWMVYDDDSEDEIYHDTFEKAEKDYNDALRDADEGTKVIMFKVVKEEFKEE